MARKSDVKLLRSPRTRVFGSHKSAISADRLLKLLRREMLNKPRMATNKKKNKKTKVRWNLIERGCLIVADRQVGVRPLEYNERSQKGEPDSRNFCSQAAILT